MIFISVLIFSVNNYAQSYHKLVNPENKWNYLYEFYPMCGKSSQNSLDTLNQGSIKCGGAEVRTYSLYFSNDTIIDSVNYDKMLCKIIKQNGNDLVYACALREDTINQKIFIRFPDQQEMLLYSFNLGIGDTVSIDTDYYKDYFTIRYIKAIGNYNFNGFAGKKISVCDTTKRVIQSNLMPPYESFTDDWYEGIGSLITLFDFQQLGVTEAEMNLLCFWNNDYLYYKKPDRSDCEYVFYDGIKEQEKQSLINIYPNPVNQQLFIDTKQPIEKIELITLPGKLLLTTQALNIDLSGFKNGFYILTIYFKSGEKISRKIIKNAL